MLKLKRVELQGFKSFCDRTELKFRGDGIAAIVGPNGCGKSNLSDAISWVLGEQSAKSLRGGRMEDVIFAGTRDRKAVGMASVTMTLVDPTPREEPVEAAPAEPVEVTVIPTVVDGRATRSQSVTKPGEITITRRLFRSGESEYLIDGRSARLRDIQDLFMGSGLGPESYAIIEQGRIGQILSSRPQDRRSIIEEAAGITRFKARKRLSEAKLESAKQNLTRVFDILEEVTRQVNSLKRQAARTKRYQELKEELDSRLRVLLAARSQRLNSEITSASAELEAAAAELREATALVAAGEQERAKIQAVCFDLESKLREVRRTLADTNVEAERTRGRLQSQVRESAGIEERIARAEQEALDLEGRIKTAETERGALTESARGLDGTIAEARAKMIAINQQREALQGRVREHEKSLEAGRVQVLRLLGEAGNLKNQLAKVDEYLAGVDRETARVAREEEGAAAEVQRLAAAREKLSLETSQRQQELDLVSGQRKETELGLSGERRRAQELRGVIDQLRGDCSRLKAQKDSLENVLSHHSYTTDAVKKLFGAFERNPQADVRPLGLLADFVEVDSDLERATEEFLHNELEYVVVQNWQQAEAGMQLLRSDLEGRATFLVEQAGAPAPRELDIDLRPLSDHLRFTNGLTGQARTLLPRLAGCYLAPEAEQARTLAEQHPHLFFLLPDGRCYHGQTLSGGRKKASGPLALKRELRQVTTDLQAREQKLAAENKTLEAVQQGVIHLEAELDRLRVVQQTREKDALALQHEARKLTEDSNRAASRISVARLEMERLEREKLRAQDQRGNHQTAIQQKETERTQREAALETLRAEMDAVETQATQIREEHSTLRANLAAIEERSRSEHAALARLENLLRETTTRRDNLTRDAQRLGEHRSRLLAENIELDRKSTELGESVLQLEDSVNRMAADETQHRQQLAAEDEALRIGRARIEAGHERRSGMEVELVRRQSELKFLDETSRKELNIALDELTATTEMDAAVEVDLDESNRLYLEVKGKIENLGPINPQALEEHQEAQLRQDFLTAQRADLVDSIRDTEKAIHEIELVSRARFLEAFEAINSNFKVSFATLFGGGHGEMRLTDEANVSESGIDIIASPPGKKLQNVLLLSGGEKSMAAMALLMAIFRYQPSPFCVLDEVDAPLDEANIGRLTRLLKEMSADTQFIVITHSKKTMESAESMYGVTMQEAGISKLVSVRFQGPALDTAVA